MLAFELLLVKRTWLVGRYEGMILRYQDLPTGSPSVLLRCRNAGSLASAS